MQVMTLCQLTKQRKKIGISQREMSRLLKKDPTFVCKLENGRRQFKYELQVKARETFQKLYKGKM